jgi:hypothetical protein
MAHTGTQIYVGNLPLNITKRQIEELFCKVRMFRLLGILVVVFRYKKVSPVVVRSFQGIYYVYFEVAYICQTSWCMVQYGRIEAIEIKKPRCGSSHCLWAYFGSGISYTRFG